MCFFVAQFAKISQMRTRYWNSVLKDTSVFSEHFVASGFEHPQLLVVRHDAEPTLELAQWGLIPSWCRSDEEAKQLSNLTLNAKGETMFEKPSFRHSAVHGRCLLPVNGFYEYQHRGTKRLPYYVSLRNEPIFSLGALYSERVNVATGRRVATFSVITTAANPLMETIHNFKKRMPLIIPAELEADWLAPSSSMADVLPLVVPFPDVEMLAWQVNPILSRGRAVNAYSSTVAINGLSLF